MEMGRGQDLFPIRQLQHMRVPQDSGEWAVAMSNETIEKVACPACGDNCEPFAYGEGWRCVNCDRSWTLSEVECKDCGYKGGPDHLCIGDTGI